MTSLWLITESDHYYPCGGGQDFVSVHDNEQYARIVFNATPVDQYATRFLVRLDSDGTITELDEKRSVRR